jgi:valyl-tRNA synthetase
MKVGRRLAIKVLNVTKFVLGLGAAEGAPITEAVDLSMLTRLAGVVGEATAAYDGYDYTRALDRIEAFFWEFCDNYVELVKARAYGEGAGAESAKSALATALSTLQRLLAPFLAFVTEEVWSWWQPGSVHRASWPDAGALATSAGDGNAAVLEAAADVLSQIRKAKTEAQKSMRADVKRAEISDTAERVAALELAGADLKEAGRIGELVLSEGPELAVRVELVDDTPA